MVYITEKKIKYYLRFLFAWRYYNQAEVSFVSTQPSLSSSLSESSDSDNSIATRLANIDATS